MCVCACGGVRCNVHTLSIDSNIAPSHTHMNVPINETHTHTHTHTHTWTLQATKNWREERPGNKASLSQAMCIVDHRQYITTGSYYIVTNMSLHVPFLTYFCCSVDEFWWCPIARRSRADRYHMFSHAPV